MMETLTLTAISQSYKARLREVFSLLSRLVELVEFLLWTQCSQVMNTCSPGCFRRRMPGLCVILRSVYNSENVSVLQDLAKPEAAVL